MSDGKVIIDTELNKRGLERGIGSVKGSLGGLTRVAGKLAGVMAAAFSIKAIVNFSREAVKLGSDLAEVQNVVDVTFSTMSDKVGEFAKNAKLTAGLSETMAKQYAGTFGAMAKAFGFTEEEAFGMSTALTQLSGDVASFYNLSQDEAFTKLKSVFTGETESLKDLGVVMTQANLDQFALAKGYGKTTAQMEEKEKVALRLEFVMQQLSAASGDFLRTSGGWANQTRVLSLQFQELKATVGQGLINAFLPIIKVINVLIGRLQLLAVAFRNTTARIFGDASQGSAGSLGGVASDLGAAADSADQLASGIDGVGAAAKKATKDMAGFDELTVIGGGSGGGAAGGLVGAIQQQAQATAGAMDEVERKAFSISSVFADKFAPSIEAWSASFAELWPHLESSFSSIGGAVSSLWDQHLAPLMTYINDEFIPGVVNSFNTNFAPVFTDVLSTAIDTFTLDFGNAALIIGEYADTYKKVFEGLQTAVTTYFNAIGEAWEKHGEPIMKNLAEFKKGFWDTFWFIYNNIIAPVLRNVEEGFKKLWDDTLSPFVAESIDDMFSIGQSLLELWNNVLKPALDFVVLILAPAVRTAFNAVGDAFMILVSLIATSIGATVKSLSGLLEFLSGVFTGDWEKAWGGIKEIFTAVWDSLKGVVKTALNAVIWAVNQFIGFIYSGIAGVVNGLMGVIEVIGKAKGENWHLTMPANPPRIPYLAQGAVLPPNKPFMAMVGDQRHGTNIEAPLDTIKQAVAEVMADNTAGMMAGFETSVGVQREILEAILGIQIGDDMISNAVNSYNRKMGVVNGGGIL